MCLDRTPVPPDKPMKLPARGRDGLRGIFPVLSVGGVHCTACPLLPSRYVEWSER